jgi:hypothetical protein
MGAFGTPKAKLGGDDRAAGAKRIQFHHNSTPWPPKLVNAPIPSPQAQSPAFGKASTATRPSALTCELGRRLKRA